VTRKAAVRRQDSSPPGTASVSGGSVARPLTQHVSGVDLQYQPAVAILFVGAEDGEYGAFLAGLGKQAVHKHRLLGESERFPGFPFVCAVPGERGLGELLGRVPPAAGGSLPAPARVPEAMPLPCPSLELVGLGALRDGHQNAAVVAPGVIVRSGQRLEEKRCRGVRQSRAALRQTLGGKASFVRNAA